MRFVRGLSLERQLPLLMGVVLAGILAASLLLTYETLRRSAEEAVRERLARASRQVANTVEAATRARAEVLRRMGREPALGRALLEPADPSSAAAVRRALAAHLAPADTTMAFELWSAAGERVIHLGPDARIDSAASAVLHAAAAMLLGDSADAVRFTPMYISDGGVYFWGIAPVRAGGARVGYLALERRVSGPREMPRVFQDLLGEDATLYLRNVDDRAWATAPGDPVAGPTRRDSTEDGVLHQRGGVGWTIVGEASIAGVPWVVTSEAPLAAVRASARATSWRLAGISAFLLAIGALFSWLISRRITRPLVSLTTAAEAIARGEHVGRVRVEGTDEVARLAASFNQMANEVAVARRELEQRVMEAQSAARALERANASLQIAVRDAERANLAKGDFLAVMSHELRTPLNAIAGYAQLLELGVHGPLNPAQQEALSRISRSQGHLLRLINDVLHFAKIDSGQVQYEIESVPLNDALINLEPLVAPQMQAKGIAFTYVPCDAKLSVRADREKLAQVMLNLLSNAIKFTPAGGRVTLRSDGDDAHARVRVRDSGIGIPADQLESIFDPFVQGDRALSRPHEGVGLGLAISRDLAIGMGGTLEVSSELRVGSEFTLTLERAMVAATAGARQDAGSALR